MSTTRTDWRARNASVAERSRRATMEQEGERGDENVSLHALVGLMIDRPHVDDVLEVGEGTFDFGKFFVEAYRVDCGQIGLFGLNNVFALVSLLAREVDGMLEEAKHAVVVGPVIIAVAMISGRARGSRQRRLSRPP